MKIISGKKITEKILNRLKETIKQKNLKPSLAVILVGSDKASQLYLRRKKETAQRIGIRVEEYLLPAQTSEEEILSLISRLNKDEQIDGILVQLPLPPSVSVDKITQAIDLKKDVDGFRGGYFSPFAGALLTALKATKVKLKDKKIIALVNSEALGKLLQAGEKDIKIDYRIGVCPELINDLKKADVIITALGRPDLIKGSMLKKGVILIDGGIVWQKGKIKGDIDRESIKRKASWFSPVPGGVGPITVALLLNNVVLAAERKQRKAFIQGN